MTAYADVKTIVQDLGAQGVFPSRKAVRHRLGDQGSYETIGKLIDQARHELGLMPETPVAPWSPPTPDPAKVAAHLEALRLETHVSEAASHLGALLAILRCLPDPLQVTVRELNRQHARSQAGLPTGYLSTPPHRAAADRVLSEIEGLIRDGTTVLQAIDGRETTRRDHGRDPIQPDAA
jgi:hypothetical protein